MTNQKCTDYLIHYKCEIISFICNREQCNIQFNYIDISYYQHFCSVTKCSRTIYTYLSQSNKTSDIKSNIYQNHKNGQCVKKHPLKCHTLTTVNVSTICTYATWGNALKTPHTLTNLSSQRGNALKTPHPMTRLSSERGNALKHLYHNFKI